MKPVKIAQIGMDHEHASAKMEAFRRFPDFFEVVGIHEPDPSMRNELKDTKPYAGLPVLTEEELFSIPGLEAVSVETDVLDLNTYAKKCVEKGLHIHMDKPAGEDLSEYEQILETAKKNKLLVQMGYMYRYNPAVQYTIEAVRSGQLGRIFEIDAQMSTRHPADYRKELARYRGGTMYNFGCHMIDLLVILMGEPDRVTPYLIKTKPEQDDLLDNGLVVFEYPGASCTVRTTSLEVNGFGRRQLVVCGTEGTIEIKPIERPTVISLATTAGIKHDYEDEKKILDIPINEDRYDAQVKDMARVIRGEAENLYPYEHDLAVHRTVLRACDIETNKEA